MLAVTARELPHGQSGAVRACRRRNGHNLGTFKAKAYVESLLIEEKNMWSSRSATSCSHLPETRFSHIGQFSVIERVVRSPELRETGGVVCTPILAAWNAQLVKMLCSDVSIVPA